MKKKYQSKILKAIHEDMNDMHEAGIINDERMRYFDSECLVQEPKKINKTAVSKSSSGETKPIVRISAKGADS